MTYRMNIFGNETYSLTSVLNERKFISSEKHVTISDQSESGYSTTNSSEEKQTKTKRKVRSGSHPINVVMPRKSHKQTDLENFNLTSNQMRLRPKQPVVPEDIDKLYQQHHKAHHVTAIPISQSAASPLYYDPLHLRNFPSNYDQSYFQPQLSSSHNDVNFSANSSVFKGILKKNHLSKSDHNLNMSSNLNYSNSIPSQNTSKQSTHFHILEPLRVPAFHPINAQSTSTSFSSLNDPNRPSAFTPVSNRKLIEDSSNEFTPTKAPAVLDCVNSAALLKKQTNEFDYSSPNPDFDTAQHDHHHFGYSASHSQSLDNHFSTHNSTSLQNIVDHSSNSPNIKAVAAPVPLPRKSIRNINKSFNDLEIRSDSVQESNKSGSCTSASPASQVETLANDLLRLRHFLDHSSGKDLKSFLLEQLETKNPKMIKAMSTLIPNSVAKQTDSHCVRCHKSFNSNERSRCYLPHPESMVEKVNQDEEGANFICHCCNSGFRLLKMDFYEETTNALLTGHCYSGQHTTNPESVDFRSNGGAAKSCEENGCVEFYV